jgi:SagB-type dehydrogenase family enzyme
MDWANQPDPFRSFEGCERILLPLLEADETPPYVSMYEWGEREPREVDLRSIGQFFELGMALSAWKEYQGTRWALRINPSSGNLHPTEGYVVWGPAGVGEQASVHHYRPVDHALETRATFPSSVWSDLMKSFPDGSFLVGLSSIHWREAWKYGERAFRYCNHDAGHALAALRLSAALLGWRLVHLANLSDRATASLLGLNRMEDFHENEEETPDLIAIVSPKELGPLTSSILPSDVLQKIASGNWAGKANKLSPHEVEWGVIDEVSQASVKPETSLPFPDLPEVSSGEVYATGGESSACGLSARQILFQRRSAVAMDGRTGMSAATFYRMLARTIPWNLDGKGPRPPWDAIPWEPRVHLCLFVHLVEGIPPGLYAFVRNPKAHRSIREGMKQEFAWERPPGCPEKLPLYFLAEGDRRLAAGQLSCGQDIAAAGAFSLGMVAEFREPIREAGPWLYRRLFWETGMIGQVLYLEAEAAGIRSTGIGCFFDDPVHDFFGFRDNRFQSLYHFTVGGPIEDTRLSTLPPYSEEQRNDPNRPGTRT